MTPYVTTLAPDWRDTDASIVLTADEARAELAAHYRALSTHDKYRYCRDCTADELAALSEALDAAPVWDAVTATTEAVEEMGAGHRAKKCVGNIA